MGRKYKKNIKTINKSKSQARMRVLSSPQQYLFNLETTSSQEAKRLWRRKIKESWDYECAYCGSDNHITIDHIVPRSKGRSRLYKECSMLLPFL